MYNYRHSSAFSLVELLVALAILAEVAAIIVPKYLNFRQQASDVVLKHTKITIQNAIDEWMALGGSFQSNSTFDNMGTPPDGQNSSPSDYLRADSFLRLVTTSADVRSALSSGVGSGVNFPSGSVRAVDRLGAMGSINIGLNINISNAYEDWNNGAFLSNGDVTMYMDPAGKPHVAYINRAGQFYFTP